MLRYFSLLLLFILAGCALNPISGPRSIDWADEPTPLPPLTEVEKATVTLKRGTVSEVLELSGRVGSSTEVPISAEKAGTVSSVLVGEGATVVAGDVLALLDTRVLDEQIAVLKSDLVSAETALAAIQETYADATNSAELQLERATLQLAEGQSNGVSETSLRILEIDVALAEAALADISQQPSRDLQLEINQLQQQIRAIEAEKATMQLVSLADGDVTAFNLRIGASVRVGTPIAVLVNWDNPVVVASANDRDIGHLQEGMPVRLSLPGVPEETFAGEIGRLPFPQGSGTARENSMEIYADNLPEFGDRVDVMITLAESVDTLWLPPSVLREFAGRAFVIARDGEQERRLDIEIGLEGAGRVEIISDLPEGTVIVAP